ncbi:N-acetylgalactosamine-6-O-sulfatase [subsurface metagenome]
MRIFNGTFSIVLIILLLQGCNTKNKKTESGTKTTDLPNMIIFLTDDQGYGDLACYGHPEIKSPNLDRFAAHGVRFTQGYASCGVCSPSRSAILTGRTPYRNGVWRYCSDKVDTHVHLKTSEITIATLLKQRGYETCHAGKWHLNSKFNSPEQPQPEHHGYDHWMATQNNAEPHHINPVNYVRNGTSLGCMEGPSSVLAATEAIDWLENRKDKDRPFFMTVWTHEPHTLVETAPKYMEPYQHIDNEDVRQYYGNITQLDDAFGILMQAVDRMGYTDNTAVFFTSDNGPEGTGLRNRGRGSTGGLRGRKRSDFEGGIRVPFIFRFPDYFQEHGIQEGTESNVPVIGHDIFTNLCMLAGIPVPGDRVIDGVNMLPALKGKKLEREQPLYWRTHVSNLDCRVALREGDWKIVADYKMQEFLMFNMADDCNEEHDLAERYPGRFADLRQKLIAHDRKVRTEGGTLDVQERLK